MRRLRRGDVLLIRATDHNNGGGSEVVFDVDGGFLHVSSAGEGTRVDVMATSAMASGPAAEAGAH